MRNTGRIDALDGWRGIAILLVLLDHIGIHLFGAAVVAIGQHGVTAFFVLSGFLITGKLREPDATLKIFYIRRFFRLMPVAWLFIGTIALTGTVHGLFPDVLPSLLFVRNYFPNGITITYWSLSLEEQFYLVWPALLLLLGVRRAQWFAALGALLSYACALAFSGYYAQGYRFTHTEVRIDAILVGCFLALVLAKEEIRARFLRWMRWAFWPAVAMIAVLCCHYSPIPSLPECLLWGAVIAYSAFEAPRFLEFAPLTWLGRISYGVYIWNMLLVYIWMDARSPLARVLVLLVPLASYYLVEEPCIRLGKRLTTRRPAVPAPLPVSASA